ncbi:MAG TPA: hypothetical protein VIV11_40575 [Kofleriaceae bacterium]
MASPLDTIAHLVLPNLMKIKGASTLVGAMERRDASPFAHVWQQTGIEHSPQLIAKELDNWRIGMMTLPTPTEMGEAYMCAFVTRKNDDSITRYFTLDYDYVLSTKTAGAVLCEREGQRMVKRGEGPTLTGDFQTDSNAFADAIMNVIAPPA